MTTHSNNGLYAVAAAILVVGFVALDVPLGSLALLGLALMCPLMMIFMMRGMGAGMHDHGVRRDDEEPARRDEHRRP